MPKQFILGDMVGFGKGLSHRLLTTDFGRHLIHGPTAIWNVVPLPLALGLFGLVGLLGGSEVRRIEAGCASDVASRLSGSNKAVSLKTRSQGLFGYANGNLASATIRASRFETDGLPFLTEPDRPKNGRLHRLKLKMTDFVLTGLRVQTLTAEIPDCRFDLDLVRREKKIRLSQTGVGTGTVRILYADLGRFAEMRFPSVKGIQIAVENGKLAVRGTLEFLKTRTPFALVGDLEIDGGVRLMMGHPSLELAGKPVALGEAQALVAMFNPIVDLDRNLHLRGAFALESLRLTPEAVEGAGKVSIPLAAR